MENESQVEQLLNQAQAHSSEGRYNEALAILNSAAKLAPKNVEVFLDVLCDRASIYGRLGRHEEAIADINQALELDPDNEHNSQESLLGMRVEAYFELGRYEEALADLNRALELDPGNDYALAIRGDVYLKLGRYEEALADINRYLELNPGDEDALRVREDIRRATTPPQPPVRSNEMSEPDRISRKTDSRPRVTRREGPDPHRIYLYSMEVNVGSPNVTLTCLSCEHKYSLWPCNNCGYNRYEYDELSDVRRAFRCLRCREWWSIWDCSNCETRNPVFETLTARPTEKDRACFVATAAYGTPYAEEVQVLRRFRDKKLRQWRYGETLIRAYEKGSPPLANWIADKPKVRLLTRKFFLSPVVWGVRKIMKPTKEQRR